MGRMNVNVKDEQNLKEVKRVVENIMVTGKMPRTIESIQDLWDVWNKVFQRNDKVSNCPTCRQTKFLQLQRTYRIYGLADKYNSKKDAPVASVKKKRQKGNRKSRG